MLGALILAAAAAAQPDPLLAEMQRLEQARGAAIKSGDLGTLRRLYAPSFHGIAAGGARVDRETLFAVFKRNAGSDSVVESTILSARRENGLVLAEGRLRIYSADRKSLISDSFYLHIYRRRGGHWEMIEGAATPIPQAAR